MADEAKKEEKAEGIGQLISTLEEIGTSLYYNGMDENSVKRGRELLNNVKILKELPNDEDRALLINESPEFNASLSDAKRIFSTEYPQLRNVEVSFPKKVTRNEQGLKTIDEAALVNLSNAKTAEDLFDIDKRESWYNWKPSQVKQYAAQAGMTQSEFLKRVAELDTANKRKHLANDGVLGKVASVFYPRIQNRILKGEDATAADVILDNAENIAQALPVGKVIGAAGKVGKAYAAANAGKSVIGKAALENSVVPTTFAFIDESREEDPDYYKAATKGLKGTLTNIFTPVRVMRNIGRVGSVAAGKAGASAITDVYRNTTDKALNNFITNKMGKDVYAEQGASYLTSLDPTGTADKLFAKLPGGGNYDAEKEAERQQQLEDQRVEALKKDYQDKLISTGVMERFIRRKYGDNNVDLWLKNPNFSKDAVYPIIIKIIEAKKKGYNAKL